MVRKAAQRTGETRDSDAAGATPEPSSRIPAAAAGQVVLEPVQLGTRRTLRERSRRTSGKLFAVLCGAATFVGVVVLAFLLVDVARDGFSVLDGQFLSSYASTRPDRAGIKAALWGTIWLLVITAASAFPVAVAAAIYLEEYAPRTWITKIIQTNIANLAGVPSIVYGILGLAVFVRTFNFERSVLSGGLTLALLILPVIIIASQEAIRAVPDSIRQGAYALGATRSQVVRTQVLPMAMPGILTGTILALSRAVGETAPLIMIGSVAYIAFTPNSVFDRFTVLPLQIYDWVRRPQQEFQALAAAAIIVLLAILLTMNSVAIFLRNRYQRRL
jgi:phosphate transport system permease protein